MQTGIKRRAIQLLFKMDVQQQCQTMPDLVPKQKRPSGRRKQVNPQKIIYKEEDLLCYGTGSNWEKQNDSSSTQLQISPEQQANQSDYTCQQCKQTFQDINQLLQHNLDVHKLHTCEVCQVTYRLKSSKLRHQKDHGKFFQCKWCKQTFSKHTDMKIHKQMHTDRTFNFPRPPNQYYCSICKKIWEHFCIYKAHCLAAHERYPCEYCDKTFTGKTNVARHTKLHINVLHQHKLIHTKSYK